MLPLAGSYAWVRSPLHSASSSGNTAGGTRSALAAASSDDAAVDVATKLQDSTVYRAAASAATALASLFPLWVILACGTAAIRPAAFAWARGEALTALLASTMLGMGCTLTVADFEPLKKNPLRVVLGVAAQYSVMPILGWLLSHHFGLPPAAAVGVAIVSACPGGTASNIVTFLAKGDVALSVAMTAVSTLLAVAATPLLISASVGTLVAVDGWGLFLSTLKVVLAPVAMGVYLRERHPKSVAAMLPFMPMMAGMLSAATCAGVVASNSGVLSQLSVHTCAAVFLLHSAGFGIAYGLSRACGMPESFARTCSIEVGMQNGALGALLAVRHFADPLTGLPAVASACMHNVMGSCLAALWRTFPLPGLSPQEATQLAAVKADDVAEFSLAGRHFAAKVVSVYDADTCRVVFYLDGRLVKFNCRLYGLDTPEMRPPKDKVRRDEEKAFAKEARAALVEWTGADGNEQLVYVQALQFDKYGRLLVNLFLPNDDYSGPAGDSLNNKLVEAGFAYEYFGGTKQEWFPDE